MIVFDFKRLSKQDTVKEALRQQGFFSVVKGIKFTPQEWRNFYSTLSVQQFTIEQNKKRRE